MKIECCECKQEITDPIWFQHAILNQMEPEIEFIHARCRTRIEVQQNMWEETSHMLIASRALKIAADALLEVGKNPLTFVVKNRDGRPLGAITTAVMCEEMTTMLNAKHEQVKRKLAEDLERNSGNRN